MKTGYEISLQDFMHLCTDHYGEAAPLLRKWFACEIIQVAQSFQIRDSSGVPVRAEVIHNLIQADFDRQGELYRVAMTLWR